MVKNKVYQPINEIKKNKDKKKQRFLNLKSRFFRPSKREGLTNLDNMPTDTNSLAAASGMSATGNTSDNWVLFAKWVVIDLILTVFVALVGTNIIFYANLTRKDLDRIFPTDRSSCPYQDKNCPEGCNNNDEPGKQRGGAGGPEQQNINSAAAHAAETTISSIPPSSTQSSSAQSSGTHPSNAQTTGDPAKIQQELKICADNKQLNTLEAEKRGLEATLKEKEQSNMHEEATKIKENISEIEKEIASLSTNTDYTPSKCTRLEELLENAFENDALNDDAASNNDDNNANGIVKVLYIEDEDIMLDKLMPDGSTINFGDDEHVTNIVKRNRGMWKRSLKATRNKSELSDIPREMVSKLPLDIACEASQIPNMQVVYVPGRDWTQLKKAEFQYRMDTKDPSGRIKPSDKNSPGASWRKIITDIIGKRAERSDLEGKTIQILKNFKANPEERNIISSHMKTQRPEEDLNGKFNKNQYIFLVKAPTYLWTNKEKPCRRRAELKRNAIAVDDNAFANAAANFLHFGERLIGMPFAGISEAIKRRVSARATGRTHAPKWGVADLPDKCPGTNLGEAQKGGASCVGENSQTNFVCNRPLFKMDDSNFCESVDNYIGTRMCNSAPYTWISPIISNKNMNSRSYISQLWFNQDYHTVTLGEDSATYWGVVVQETWIFLRVLFKSFITSLWKRDWFLILVATILVITISVWIWIGLVATTWATIAGFLTLCRKAHGRILLFSESFSVTWILTLFIFSVFWGGVFGPITALTAVPYNILGTILAVPIMISRRKWKEILRCNKSTYLMLFGFLVIKSAYISLTKDSANMMFAVYIGLCLYNLFINFSSSGAEVEQKRQKMVNNMANTMSAKL